jgi:hypothetical protein
MNGGAGVATVAASALLGAIITIALRHDPGTLLGSFIILGTLVAGVTVRTRSVRLIIPAPALSYVVAAVLAGAINDRAMDTSHVADLVNLGQWIAAGFKTMAIATLLAVVITAVRVFLAVRGYRHPLAAGRGAPRGSRPMPDGTGPYRRQDGSGPYQQRNGSGPNDQRNGSGPYDQRESGVTFTPREPAAPARPGTGGQTAPTGTRRPPGTGPYAPKGPSGPYPPAPAAPPVSPAPSAPYPSAPSAPSAPSVSPAPSGPYPPAPSGPYPSQGPSGPRPAQPPSGPYRSGNGGTSSYGSGSYGARPYGAGASQPGAGPRPSASSQSFSSGA